MQPKLCTPSQCISSKRALDTEHLQEHFIGYVEGPSRRQKLHGCDEYICGCKTTSRILDPLPLS